MNKIRPIVFLALSQAFTRNVGTRLRYLKKGGNLICVHLHAFYEREFEIVELNC